MTNIIVDSHIIIDKRQLPEYVVDLIKDELTIESDGTVDRLYGFDGNSFILPRGYLSTLMYGLEASGIDFDIYDKRCADKSDKTHKSFPLREHQIPAIDTLMNVTEGIYQSPPGSGKTVVVIDLIRKHKFDKNIILVNKIEIAEQWMNRVKQFLPESNVGMIGDGVWDENEITIALVQTLWSRRDSIEDEWFKKWGFMCLDECHHQTAETFQHVISRFSSRVRIGVSATPDKTGDFEYALAVLGDIVYVTTKDDLRDKGILHIPTVHIVETNFEFDFHGDFFTKKGQDCRVKGCKKTRKQSHYHRNNYQTLLKRLVNDNQRNRLVADKIIEYKDNHQLVVSKRLDHLYNIQNIANQYGIESFLLTGKESRQERVDIIDKIQNSDYSCTFSTIADEALDVPVLNRIHVPWPIANPGSLRQLIGRGERTAESKKDSKVIDYCDRLVGPLKNHFRKRMWEVYKEDGYIIEYE